MNRLKAVLAQTDTVLFVGSGTSIWSGLPSWGQLIGELVNFVETSGAQAALVRAEAQRGDLLQAASYGFDKLTKQQIGDFIRKACRYGVAKPHEIHRRLVLLGPRCFITTNYDNLIEESLRQWLPERFFRPPVTNRHLTETAEIIHARAVDFVFKPHGDAADSESIILTREQYRQLLPGGERQAALESVKMLLASRPVVYVGFGLRDPDFIYVKDLLANTYKGGTRDHYAIFPDVSGEEVDYWRRNYGIHLVGYQTTARADGSRDHHSLLDMLEELSTSNAPRVTQPSPIQTAATYGPEVILALMRHAARLTRISKNVPEFLIRVSSERDTTRSTQGSLRAPDRFRHYPIDRFLDEGPERAILIGLPGAGKTYSLQQAGGRLAQRLYEACLAEAINAEVVVVPILVDLKLYRGDLLELVNQTLPGDMPVEVLARRFKLKIFIDSFNEMPREYREGGYEADFARFMSALEGASVILGSRTPDGLAKMRFPIYSLDQIDVKSVADELQRLRIDIRGRFEDEVMRLLQKPFYFHLVIKRKVELPKHPRPRDLYQALFAGLEGTFERQFGTPFGLQNALEVVAYDAVNRGEEAILLADVLRVLRTRLQGAAVNDTSPKEIANWLVSKGILFPYSGGRVAFFHQSATEFLAASELARRYLISPHVVVEKLSLTRWDQSLFLALSLLPEESSDAFITMIADADFVLALTAAKYLESGREAVISRLLAEIPKRSHAPSDFSIPYALEVGLDLSEVHERALRAIMARGCSIGAAAVKCLARIKGESLKSELFLALVESRSDFNYCCNGVGPALLEMVSESDLPSIVEMVDRVQDEIGENGADDDDVTGFVSGMASACRRLGTEQIKAAFMPGDNSAAVPHLRAEIVCDVLRNRHDIEALSLAGELLLRGVSAAATTIYFVAHFGKMTDAASWRSFGPEHLRHLIAGLSCEREERWFLSALACLCRARADLAEAVKQIALDSAGIKKAALMFCVLPEADERVFEGLAELLAMSEAERRVEPTHLIKQMELSWIGHECLLVSLLKLRDTKLALEILEEVGVGDEIGKLEVGPVRWWLEWIMGERDSGLSFWLRIRFSSLFSQCLTEEAGEALLAEFNNPCSQFRGLLASSILLERPNISTGDFTDDSVSFLLADLARSPIRESTRGHLLGCAATEAFVKEHLLPLMPDAEGIFLGNLRKVLRQAGARHGRRYISD